MVDLPYDIWLHISTFLPPVSLWELRVLNRALYDIAFDIRYKRVEIPVSIKAVRKYSRGFRRFRDDMAKRVREIVYHPDAKTLFPPKPFKKSKIPKLLASFQKGLANMGAENLTPVKNTMTWFTNFHTLRVQTHYRMVKLFELEFFLACRPLFHINLRVSSDTLRNLELSLPHNLFVMSVPSGLFLPRLDTLSLIFSHSTAPGERRDQPSFKATAEYTIAPFVNRHGKTLASIDFRIYGFTESLPMVAIFSISSLFQAIKRIVNLRSISFGMTPFDGHETMANFFKLHSETLQEIVIYLYDGYQHTDKLFARINEKSSPKLKVLIIREREYTSLCGKQHPGNMSALIHRCASSLTSLNLTHAKCSWNHLCYLLSPVGHASISFVMMSSLSINIAWLTTHILDLFVDRLPNLQELDLRVDIQILSDENGRVINGQSDYEMVTRRPYSHWNLKHFNFLLSHEHDKNQKPSHELTLLLVYAFPSLLTFCGVDTAFYLPGIPT